MDTQAKLTLQVVEVLHYSADVDKAVEFYHGRLGWPVIWSAPGNMAVIDAGGAYQLTIVAAKWTGVWEEGQPVPGPKLALESKDLKADVAVLAERGITGLEIGGDPASMLMLDLSCSEGIELFVWQDTEEQGATQVVEDYRANRQPPAIYALGECLLFFNDKPTAEQWFIDKLGFSVKERHGDAFTALSIDDGPVLGIYDQANWWDAGQVPEVPVRLFLECPDILVEHARQSGAGLAPGELHDVFDGLKWFDLADPDGNVMTFWQYQPAQ